MYLRERLRRKGSMSDELRDRIMEPIWQNTMLTTEGAKGIAQAIIDDLGLTVEDRNDGSESRTALDGSIVYGVKSRVVGGWEKQ